MERLNATQDVLDTDRRENLSTNTTCGDSPKTARAALPGLTDVSALSTAPDAGRRTQQLEGEAVNPKNAALAHLRRYQDIEDFKIGGGASVRVAPSMVPNFTSTVALRLASSRSLRALAVWRNAMPR